MKTLTIGILKNQFSQIIDQVKHGEEFTVAFGKKKEKVAVIVPYKKYISKKKIKLGILEGKGKITISSNFKITDEEFLKS